MQQNAFKILEVGRRTGRPLMIVGLCVFLCLLSSCQRQAYLYTSFHEPAKKGLRLLYSDDGYHWDSLPGIFLAPLVGKDTIMRDPSMVKGPDGVFHLVWTLAWKGNQGIGYASSRNLMDWSEERVLDVMGVEKQAVNVWAPELYYRQSQKDYLIVWASTIPYRYPKGQEEENNNHRLYYTLTKDFKHFSSPRIYYNPGYSSIDATLVKRGAHDFVLVFKDNTRPERNLKVAFGTSALGPFKQPSASFTPKLSEGPSVLKKKGAYLIYYDWYQNGKFGAVKTTDFKTFKNISDVIAIPEGHKHGTIVPVSRHFVKKIKRELHSRDF